MSEILRYDNGLKVGVETIPSLRSVSVGYWAGVGSSKELPEINGLSHFTEHMMFKGTSKLSPFQIARRFDEMGTISNAFTGKEMTCYYIKTIDDYVEPSFELLSDLVFDSAFPEEELDKERKVIVEEINMVEDAPEDICYDVIASAVYKDRKLGQTILGSIDNVKRFNGDDIRRFMTEFYVPSNMAITMAGGITVEEADALVRKYCLDRFKGDKRAAGYEPKHEIVSDCRYKFKDFEQTNIAVAYPTISVDSEEFMRQAYLSLILGGGMSSRLFQTIREQMGLAYSVYSVPSVYRNNGSFNVFVNITPKNTERVVRCLKEEIDDVAANGITDEEFERARIQLKTSCVFGFENPQSIMNSIAKPLLMLDKNYDLDGKIAEIEAVTKQQVNKFARNYLTSDKVCAAYVGKKTDVDILNILKGV